MSTKMDEVGWEADLISGMVETVEVPWEEGASLINECTYLFATDVREIEELTLGLTIVETKAQASLSAKEATGPLAWLKIGGRPIEEDETCRLFQLLFDRNHMISYTVLNETYGKYPEPPEVFTGKLFCIFSHSHLLGIHRANHIRLRRPSWRPDALRDCVPQSCHRCDRYSSAKDRCRQTENDADRG